MTDILTKEKRSWNMSRIKGKDTKPELTLRSLLHKSGLRFRLHEKKLPGRPDIVLPRYKTAIFVNGCFWHRHDCKRGRSVPKTRTDFWVAKIDKNVERDQRVYSNLKNLGWKVLIIWECQIREGKALEGMLNRHFGSDRAD